MCPDIDKCGNATRICNTKKVHGRCESFTELDEAPEKPQVSPSNSSDLLCCPLCKSDVKTKTYSSYKNIECAKCELYLVGYYADWEETKKKWNTRVYYTSEMSGSGQFGVCAKCKKGPTNEGHDGCLGTLGGDIMNACCGHGDERTAYIQYWSGKRISGKEAIEEQVRLIETREI